MRLGSVCGFERSHCRLERQDICVLGQLIVSELNCICNLGLMRERREDKICEGDFDEGLGQLE